METKTMSKESIVFESPAEVNAEVIQNGEMLLVKLKFPGLRKSDVPQPEPVRERRSFFSCFNSSEDSQPIQKCEWFKFVADKRHSGDWITLPADRQPTNCELWLQVFRYRISIMLSPQNSRNSTTSDSGVTQYFFWNSGCMDKALNFRKCEMLIDDDFISLRLACSKSLWGEEDVKNIEKSRRGENSKEVNVESDRKFPEINAICDETYSVSTSESVKEERSTTINYNNLKGEGGRSKDDINEESSTQNATITKAYPNKVASEG
ncbi:unnamed protein product [Hymenolepis diminuta]|uniref:SHSP domain-containing protein n=1 Tax=Hymenolepis diminuta TaxID=6216 RepID=A0A0R3SMJ5_HYMDI|nr:unnamed protein product [Hymenolepis diminuta]